MVYHRLCSSCILSFEISELTQTYEFTYQFNMNLPTIYGYEIPLSFCNTGESHLLPPNQAAEVAPICCGFHMRTMCLKAQILLWSS